MSLNLIERAPQWLRVALNLQEVQVPQHLDMHAVVPVAELLQGGFPGAFYSVEGINSGNGVDDLVDAATIGAPVDADWSCVVLAMHALNGAAAGIGNIYLHQKAGNASALSWSKSMAANEFVGHNAIAPGGFIVVPPGFKLRTQGHAAAQVGYQAVVCCLPPGVRPW